MGLFIGTYYLHNGKKEYNILDVTVDEAWILHHSGFIVKFGRWHWLA